MVTPPVQHTGIRTDVVRRDRLLVALPAGLALADRDELRVSDLRDEDFIAHAGHGQSVMGQLLSAICADAGFTPRVRHEVRETSTLVTLVAADLGVAVVPDPISALDIAGVRYLPLAPATLGVDLIAARLESAHAPLIDRVLALLHGTLSSAG